MGYKLNSLLHLPLDATVEMYVFSIGDKLWEGGLGAAVHNNFDNIARSIGSAAIIVGGLEERFHGEVVETYLGKKHEELFNELPALLVTDAHPDDLSDGSLRLLIPLREAHKRYELIDEFLRDLTSFVRGESDDLLNRLEAAPKPQNVVNEVVRVNIPVVPGFVAVNLNSAVPHLRQWWNRRVAQGTSSGT